jgi:uncharacterized protein (TIGR02284 family)
MDTTNKDQDIKKLNSLLRGEIAAVETYGQCIEKMKDSATVAELRALQSSHQLRVHELRQQIIALGGQPEQGSGAWGAFAKLVEGGAKVFGESAAISALEEGEDKGKRDYADLDDLSPSVRNFVQRVLVPEQRRTHDALSQIEHRM